MLSGVNTLLEKRRNIARRIDALLGEHPGVTSVYVFGSVASGHVDEQSDVDITLVCRSNILPLSVRKETLTSIGSDWQFDDPLLDNPIWDVQDNIVVDGIRVELHYQTAPAISNVLDQVVQNGATTTEKVPRRPYTVAALVQRAWLLRDKDGVFHRWLEQTEVYPQRLKLNILRHYAPILRDSVEEFKTSAERQLGPLVSHFFLFFGADALTSLLFALNEMYDPADRREERTILPTLPRVPRDFISRFTYVLEGPFDDPGALKRALAFEKLASEVLGLADYQMG